MEEMTDTRQQERGISPSPDPIFQMLTGFWVSKSLMTAVELEVFTKLAGKSVNMQQLQKILEMENRPAKVFSTALVSLGLLSKVERRTSSNGNIMVANDEQTEEQNDYNYYYSNSHLADTFLVKGKPGYMGDIISMFDKRLYKSWDKLNQSLKTNKPIVQEEGGDAESIWNQAKSNQAIEQMKKFTHAMHGLSIGPAMTLTKVFDFSTYNKMMDVGGGSGVYSIQVVKENPNMHAVILDVNAVCQVANGYIERFNLQDKIQTQPLDFFKEDLPEGCDLALLSHILHDHSEEKGRLLLKKIYDSLVTGKKGAVIISEWLLNDEKTGPQASALMGLNMIVETTGGRNYSFVEISEMLMGAGFNDIEKRPLAGPAEIVIGYK
jgi:3-hydroxy-5-methyl-1-naphthoate 3-O-methyltransferase